MSRDKGALGEIYAARYLREKKYKILAANYSSRFGEIDIIAQNKEYIVFVEVKMRSSNSIVSGREAVNNKKQKRIIATALQYLSVNRSELQPRFDVIEIQSDEGKVKKIMHIENAFSSEARNEIF